jgi:hemerythrin-like domain-containing protein
MGKNAIELLKEDHLTLKKLLSDLTETTPRAEKTRRRLLEEIDLYLSVHTQIEEEIFYPAFEVADGAEHRRICYEAIEEHRAVDRLVFPDLKKTDPRSEQFSGRARVLKELVEHHADEEEQTMFEAAQKAMSVQQLIDLGERMRQRRRELQS